jgi:secretion/DNA translocation related CpaE-like protein
VLRPLRDPGTQALLVVGACGGIGSSTLAALLACERARSGERVALVDLDHGHGGVEVLLGIEAEAGARWLDLRGVRGTVSGQDLEGVLPQWRGVEVLSAGREPDEPPPAALEAVWSGLVDGCRTVVADVPRHLLRAGEPQAWVPSDAGVSSVLLMVTSQDVVGVAAGMSLREAVGDLPARVVVRRRRGARVAPAEVADALGLDLAGTVPDHNGVAPATDRGLGPLVGRRSRLGRAVRTVSEVCRHG